MQFSINSYLLVSDKKAVGMFMFTHDLIIGQQVCELLNKADHLRTKNKLININILLKT